MDLQVVIVVLAQIFVLYVATVGIGMVIGGNAGARRAHTWWMKSISRTLAWCLSAIGDLFQWLAKKVRR